MDLQDSKVLRSSIIKKALGYNVDEVTEEFALKDDNNLALVKRKVSTKHIPPDYSAFKVLCEYFGEADDDISSLSDEELNKSIKQLITSLSEEDLCQKK